MSAGAHCANSFLRVTGLFCDIRHYTNGIIDKVMGSIQKILRIRLLQGLTVFLFTNKVIL